MLISWEATLEQILQTSRTGHLSFPVGQENVKLQGQVKSKDGELQEQVGQKYLKKMNTFTIHVWYIYLHTIYMYVCKYTMHGSYGNGIECFFCSFSNVIFIIYHYVFKFNQRSQIRCYFEMLYSFATPVLSCTRGSREFLIHTTNSR